MRHLIVALIFSYGLNLWSSGQTYGPIFDFPNITAKECGSGRKPLEPNANRCFKYHKNLMSGKIQLARDALEFEVPWIALVVVDFGEPRSQCGGSLLNSNWLITAAHCMFCDDLPCEISKIKVYIGILNNQEFMSNKMDNEFSIQRIIINPGYMKSGKQENDLALIKLDRGVIFSRKANYWKVISICLPRLNYTHIQDELGLIAGWGTTTASSLEYAKRLKIAWVKLQAISNDTQDDFGKLIVVQRTRETGSTACFGDSGGPLFQYYNGKAVLIGVTAGSVIADPDAYCPGLDYREAVLYTRVSNHIPWIIRVLQSV